MSVVVVSFSVFLVLNLNLNSFVCLFPLLLFAGLCAKALSRLPNSPAQRTQTITRHMFHSRAHSNKPDSFHSEYHCSDSGGEKLNIGKIEIVLHDKIIWKLWETFYYVQCTCIQSTRSFLGWTHKSNAKEFPKVFLWVEGRNGRKKAVKQNLSEQIARKNHNERIVRMRPIPNSA